MKQKNFKSERLSRTAKITLEGEIEHIFPLFGAIEETKWADGWQPLIIYSQSGKIERGMVFLTNAHNHHETVYNWIVSGYEPKDHHIEYIVSTPNRYWIINIQCNILSDVKTEAIITYTYTSLNSLGNEINKHSITKMFEKDLKDWEEAINHYIKTGNILK